MKPTAERPQRASQADALASGLRRQRFERRAHTFTIAADPSFSSLWLAPRLDRVRAALGRLDVRIVMSIALDSMLEEDIDLAISYRKSSARELASADLFTERGVPACAPALIGNRSDTATAFDRLPLLHIDQTMGDAVYPTWANWFTAAGRQRKNIDHGPRFPLTVLATQAAISGMGALLASELVLREHFRSGQLVEIAREIPTLTINRRLVWPVKGPKARHAAAVAAALAAAADTEGSRPTRS